MPDGLLKNIGALDGLYDSKQLILNTSEAETILVNGLTAVKTANKAVWVNGELDYTVLITNNAEFAFENPVFNDTLQIADIDLVPDSVTYNSAAIPYDYNDTTGLLEVDLPTIGTGASGTLAFKVRRKI